MVPKLITLKISLLKEAVTKSLNDNCLVAKNALSGSLSAIPLLKIIMGNVMASVFNIKRKILIKSDLNVLNTNCLLKLLA